MSLRTPLGRVRGLGSAKEGTDHWWLQRVTAIALVPLCLWFVIFIIKLTGASHELASLWVQQPINAILLILLITVVFYHAILGLQVVIEDYVQQEWLKLLSLLLMKFVLIIAGFSAIFAVLRIAL